MSLRAGEGDWSSVFSFFSVVIRLTDVGHGEFHSRRAFLYSRFMMHVIFTYFISLMVEHMEDIIGLLFRYITLLQTSGTPKWIFDEVNYGFGFFFFLEILSQRPKLIVTSV